MQRGTSHGGAGHVDRFEHGDRRHTAGTPHLHGDVEQFGVDLFGRVFVGDGPARRARGGTEGALQAQVIDLDDNAVERMLDVATMLAVVLDHVQDLLE